MVTLVKIRQKIGIVTRIDLKKKNEKEEDEEF